MYLSGFNALHKNAVEEGHDAFRHFLLREGKKLMASH